MADVILQANDLHYNYPGKDRAADNSQTRRAAALDGADVAIPRGARLALLGANGAGKTTLLLLLNGLLRPSRGAVLLEGDPADYSRKGLLRWRQKVGMVFQDPDDQLFAASVQQDVSFGPMNLGLSEPQVRQRVDQALDAMGIAHLAESPVHALSSGQKKRAAIAGVLAMEPEVLLLDEPTAGLDPRGVEQFLATLEALHAAGTTIVISTHEVDVAYAWAGDAAILTDGRISAQGPPAEVLADETQMQAAHLRVPWVLALAARLRSAGRDVPSERTPRTFEELCQWMDK